MCLSCGVKQQSAPPLMLDIIIQEKTRPVHSYYCHLIMTGYCTIWCVQVKHKSTVDKIEVRAFKVLVILFHHGFVRVKRQFVKYLGKENRKMLRNFRGGS